MNDVINVQNKQWQLEKIIAYFFIYSFIGWVFEEILFLVLYNEFVYRGFLYLPILPIYGFGAALVSILFPDKDYAILSIAIVGGLLCTFIEYMTSIGLEKIFKLSLWDYSDLKYNLDGRISLISSIGFSLACVLVVKVFNPLIEKKLSVIKNTKLIEGILSFLITIAFIDFAFSLMRF